MFTRFFLFARMYIRAFYVGLYVDVILLREIHMAAQGHGIATRRRQNIYHHFRSVEQERDYV